MQLTPLEEIVRGDLRVTTALLEENYGPMQHRLDYLNERFREAGYEVPEKEEVTGDSSAVASRA